MTVDVDRPVFVVGCPRSGTTLLSLMLHAHPRLAIPPETRFLISTWRERHRFGDLSTRQQRRALAKACVRKKSRITDLDLDPDEAREAILAAPPTIGSAFGTVFRLYAEKHGAARWGDKRPAYFQEVDVLLRLFPDAQVVHVVRDARANVASLKSMPWWPYGSIGSMATWAQAEWCSRRNAHRLPSHAFHVVRYESLVADPEPVLRELCTFLGEDFDPAMLQPAAVSDVVPEGKTWHGNLANDVSTDRVDAWRDDLEPWEIGLLEAALRRSLRRWDYPLSGAGSTPAPHRLARFAVELGYRHLTMRSRWGAEQRDARRATHPVAAQLTTGQRRIAAERGELLQPG